MNKDNIAKCRTAQEMIEQNKTNNKNHMGIIQPHAHGQDNKGKDIKGQTKKG